MARSLVIAFVTLCFLHHLPTSDCASKTLDWTYEGALGPQTWGSRYSQCKSAHQSPIDIISKDAVYSPSLKPFTFTYNASTKSNFSIYNGGANVVIDFGTTQWSATFKDENAESFQPMSMHFHWGLTDNTGSEHHMDKVTYALEGHIVMMNKRDFTTWDEAVKGVNGLAVVGVFFEHDDTGSPNPTLESITKAMNASNILQCNCTTKTPENTAELPFFHLSSIFPKNDKFFRYKGSLTTPPCTENVLWSLYSDRMKVTTEQINIFRKVKYPPSGSDSGKFMAGNHRPVLPLNPESALNAVRYVSSSYRVGVSAASRLIIFPMTWMLIISIFGLLMFSN